MRQPGNNLIIRFRTPAGIGSQLFTFCDGETAKTACDVLLAQLNGLFPPRFARVNSFDGQALLAVRSKDVLGVAVGVAFKEGT